jgi:DNA polymerase-3 subunit alpha
MISFAEYAFNKSHAAAYSLLAYQTAYLKNYYPVEFMAALMTSVIGDATQIAKYIRNCAEMKIEVLPPDVNESSKKFTVKDRKIRFGLLGVKNVGEGVIDAIVKAREEKGFPKDIFQFINNIDIHELNKKAVESLIKAGALDCLSGNRAQHLSVFEGLIESAQNNSRKNIEGQLSLFQMNAESMQSSGVGGQLPDVAEFSKDLLMAMEKEMLGVYLTGHPLSDYAEQIVKISTITSEDLAHAEGSEDVQDGMAVTMAGMISSKKTLITKKNKMMAFIQLEDLYGTTEVIVFPNVYEASLNLLKNDGVVVVRGSVNFKEDEEPKLLADRIFDINDFNGFNGNGNGKIPGPHTVKITIPEDLDEAQALAQIREIIMEHRGDTPVVITAAATNKKYKTKSDLWVNPNDSFRQKLSGLVGRENIQ